MVNTLDNVNCESCKSYVGVGWGGGISWGTMWGTRTPSTTIDFVCNICHAKYERNNKHNWKMNNYYSNKNWLSCVPTGDEYCRRQKREVDDTTISQLLISARLQEKTPEFRPGNSCSLFSSTSQTVLPTVFHFDKTLSFYGAKVDPFHKVVSTS